MLFKPLWKSWRWQMHRCISYFCAKTNTTRKPTEQKIKKLTQQAQLGSFSYFCFWVSNKHTCAISNWNSVVLSNVQIFSAILKIILRKESGKGIFSFAQSSECMYVYLVRFFFCSLVKAGGSWSVRNTSDYDKLGPHCTLFLPTFLRLSTLG